jgi:preprotein translocase subunit SecD
VKHPANSYYALIDAQPVQTGESRPSHPPAASIKLELRWIVSCTDAAHSVPLRGDEAASRYCLSETPVVDQSYVDSASTFVDAFNRLGVSLTFTPEGAEKLRRATTGKENTELGLVIDGDLVLKAIVLQSFGREVAISGAGVREEELLDWVARLNAEARKRAFRKTAAGSGPAQNELPARL